MRITNWSTSHLREAELYLRLAADQRVNNRFADPQTAELLLGLSQAHAALANLPEQQVIAQERLATVLRVVVERVITMATHHESAVRKQAEQLMRDLDEAGANIDDLVDECSAEVGRGPSLYNAFGSRYDLTKQWVDRRGKRWEYTGSWSDDGSPVMSRDERDGDSLVLPELIREYGPLQMQRLMAPSIAPATEVDCPF